MAKPTVAILGASADPSKFGNKAVRAHIKMGYDVYPINPKGGQIEGLDVYASLADLPVDHLDRISVYLPPAVTEMLLDEIAGFGCDELWLNPGSENDRVVEKARELGLDPIVACSIVDLGISPSDV
jgi:predicted CoA-binding protein